MIRFWQICRIIMFVIERLHFKDCDFVTVRDLGNNLLRKHVTSVKIKEAICSKKITNIP